MSLEPLIEPPADAWTKHFSIAGLNVDSMEMLQGVLTSAERADSPIFLQVTVDT